MRIAYPFAIDHRGRTAEASEAAYTKQLIEQVLFTTPGERVNRPDFGSGIMQLLFAPDSGHEMTTAVEYLVHGALQQWLGDLIQFDVLHVDYEEATLRVMVQYTVRGTRQRHVAQFQRIMPL
jgi:phage baseplate assembly protein W